MLRVLNVSRRLHKVKVKCTLVQALRLCTGRTVHRGSRGIALLFLDDGTSRGWGVSVTPRPLFAPGKDPVSIVQEAGWAPAPVWTGAENVAPVGIRSPDRPARSQSLYRLGRTESERTRGKCFRIPPDFYISGVGGIDGNDFSLLRFSKLVKWVHNGQVFVSISCFVFLRW